ncbi:hypothetical protein vbSpy7_13 [Streptococcus phage vb_Spy_7]|nr:hypothetical protein vbSpy7_13 [Streptococcus phage vb_Spy_7]
MTRTETAIAIVAAVLFSYSLMATLYGAAVNRKRRALQADLDYKTSLAGRIETYYDVIRRGDLKHLRGDRT